MGCFYSKKVLYEEIDHIRETKLKVSNLDYPLDLVKMCQETDGIKLEKLSFKTQSLRGIAILGEDQTEDDIILLNSNLTASELNFYCGHELIHLILHRREPKKQFNCYDKVMPNQNCFFEWHANEGSAEMLIPYKLLLPKIKKAKGKMETWHDLSKLRSQLSKDFFVSDIVMELRLKSLKYEISQFLDGTCLEKIKILSARQQAEQNINIKSLVDIEKELFAKELYLKYPSV